MLKMMFTNNNAQPIIDAYSRFGLGDSLIDFIFFSQIAQYLEDKNIIINYHCKESHHANLNLFKASNNIRILPYATKGYELWQTTENLNSGKFIEDILCDMFNKFLKVHGIPIVLDTFEYKDSNLLLKTVETEDYGIDTLIINNEPKSMQFNHDKSELNQFIIDLSKTRKVVVTEYLNDSITSLHDKSVRYIAQVAKKAKTIIAINTGPSLGLYNSEILDAIDNLYLLDTTNHYIFKTRKLTKVKYIRDLHFLL